MSTSAEPDPARGVWAHLRALMIAPDVVAAEHELLHEAGLTAGPVRALRALLEVGPQPMRVLAEHMGCDKSYVTGLVKPLISAGLVTIEPYPTDGRMKIVTPTKDGLSIAARARRIYDTPPSALNELNDRELQQLLDLLVAATGRGR